jgi:hypothetical protein
MIDCDVHNNWSSADVLLPYLPRAFREYAERGELPGGRGSFPAAHRAWLHPEDFFRTDATPPSGEPAGSDLGFMREQLLDRYSIDHAILNGEEAIEVSTLANPYYAQALAGAYNEWVRDEWLPRDERFLASLVVAPQDPAGAAAEIRRRGGEPRFAQVLVSSGSQRPYGDPFYHPIRALVRLRARRRDPALLAPRLGVRDRDRPGPRRPARARAHVSGERRGRSGRGHRVTQLSRACAGSAPCARDAARSGSAPRPTRRRRR